MPWTTAKYTPWATLPGAAAVALLIGSGLLVATPEADAACIAGQSTIDATVASCEGAAHAPKTGEYAAAFGLVRTEPTTGPAPDGPACVAAIGCAGAELTPKTGEYEGAAPWAPEKDLASVQAWLDLGSPARMRTDEADTGIVK